RLAPVLNGRGRAVITARGPVRIALRALLLDAGVTLAAYAADGGPAAADAVAVDAGPLPLFKALQLVHSRALEHEFTDYVAFDLETTDNNVDACEVVEIGAVRVRGGRVVDRFHSLVRPRGAVSAAAREVHGYSDEDLSAAPPFESIWPPFRAFVGADLLVAHNALEFDFPVLRRLAAPLGGIRDVTVYDSLLLARSLFRSGARLATLAERFGIPAGRAHHALDDAETLAAVIGELGRLQLARARKAALVNVLDHLGLGLALWDGPGGDEAEVFRELCRPYALGRYSRCLDFYAAERRRLDDPGLPVLEDVIERLGGAGRMAQLRAERSAAQRYPEAYARLRRLLDGAAGALGESVDRFLDQVALSASDGVDVDRHRVNLLTLHSTKGLEFSRVYVIGAEDHELPGYYQTTENRIDEIEEARRLLYVGMTRARDRLVLTRAERRNGRDAGGNRFLDEMGVVPKAEGRGQKAEVGP
ncbi:MAG TPA: exonuclease domain-containing protein, partial [Gemmatimonadales bacterium]|nr:exonuclease domain-containing protein [Gemmatimonadales bacterium]